MDERASDSEETLALLRQAQAGEDRAFDRLFARYQPQLRRFVELRLDAKLRARLDPADVVQEAYIEALRRLEGFLDNPPMPFKLWLRQITLDRLLMMRRRHVGAARRSVDREAAWPDGSSCALARQILAADSTPSSRVGREELARRVREAVGRLSEADREIILMRTFEALSFEEVANLLDIEPAAARKRHGRALLRLHKVLTDEGLTESQL
jgi:RNA polymerase sigma-70 factor (ECF subfamily)